MGFCGGHKSFKEVIIISIDYHFERFKVGAVILSAPHNLKKISSFLNRPLLDKRCERIRIGLLEFWSGLFLLL